MSSLLPSDSGDSPLAMNSALNSKSTRYSQRKVEQAAGSGRVAAAADKQATDWLEMRRAAGWPALEINHTSR